MYAEFILLLFEFTMENSYKKRAISYITKGKFESLIYIWYYKFHNIEKNTRFFCIF